MYLFCLSNLVKVYKSYLASSTSLAATLDKVSVKTLLAVSTACVNNQIFVDTRDTFFTTLAFEM